MGHVEKVCKSKKTEASNQTDIAEQAEEAKEVLFMTQMRGNFEKSNI